MIRLQLVEDENSRMIEIVRIFLTFDYFYDSRSFEIFNKRQGFVDQLRIVWIENEIEWNRISHKMLFNDLMNCLWN